MTLEVETYQDPGNSRTRRKHYPPLTGCEKQVFKPVLLVNPTTTEADSPVGSRPPAEDSAVPRLRGLAVADPLAVVTLRRA